MQTNYNINTPVAFEGMLSDTTQHKDVLSLNNKDTAVFIGKLVSRGTAEDEIIHPAAAADITDLKKARGVVIHHHALASAAGSEAAQYPVKDIVNVLHKGRCWVVFEDAPDVAAAVSVRYAGTGVKGAFRSVAVTNETAVLPNAKIIRTAPNNFAEIEIDL